MSVSDNPPDSTGSHASSLEELNPGEQRVHRVEEATIRRPEICVEPLRKREGVRSSSGGESKFLGDLKGTAIREFLSGGFAAQKLVCYTSHKRSAYRLPSFYGRRSTINPNKCLKAMALASVQVTEGA